MNAEYGGTSPESENESKDLIKIISEKDYDAVIYVSGSEISEMKTPFYRNTNAFRRMGRFLDDLERLVFGWKSLISILDIWQIKGVRNSRGSEIIWLVQKNHFRSSSKKEIPRKWNSTKWIRSIWTIYWTSIQYEFENNDCWSYWTNTNDGQGLRLLPVVNLNRKYEQT